MTDIPKELVEQATRVRENAVADFSKFKVGAALRTDGGDIFTGCNVENATLGLTVCTERVALFKALSEGARAFTEIVVVTAAEKPTSPCGACRQMLWEFCGDIPVYMVSTNGTNDTMKTSALFPRAFDKSGL